MRLYQINTRLLLEEFSPQDTKVQLKDIPEAFWLQLVKLGFDSVWLMGLWKVRPDMYTKLGLKDTIYDHYSLVLPNISQKDLGGSLYAIDDYIINPSISSEEDFIFFKRRLNTLGLKVVLDFIPNHFHQYSHLVYDHPEMFFVTDKQISAGEHAHTYELPETEKYIYHGKDPHFEPWNDTVQVNYSSEIAQNIMIKKLEYVASLCDGVRCDMTMLMLKDVFNETWVEQIHAGGYEPMQSEWWNKAIGTIKAQNSEFLFLAEVYWGLDEKLRKLGFDITYDKDFYDALEAMDHLNIKNSLKSKQASHLLRFIENHDEPRAVSHFGRERAHALAVLLLMIPGNILIQHGQMQGFTKRVPVQLLRNPEEEVQQSLVDLYTRLLMITKQEWFQKSSCQVIDTKNDSVIGIVREYQEKKVLILVNLSDKLEEVSVQMYNVHEKIYREVLSNIWYPAQDNEIKLTIDSFGSKILEI